jgi:dienelactone hydrolase
MSRTMTNAHRNEARRRTANLARASALLFLGLALTLASPARADERVQFPSLDGKLSLTGFLYRPDAADPAPAVVMLHGCSGLSSAKGPFPFYRDWRDFLTGKGYVVLMPDSAASRGFGQTCTVEDQRKRMMAERPADAYAALAFLQTLPFVRPDKIALIGWSQGGGIVLLAIPTHSSGRPTPAPAHDFSAAIAFYPGGCSDKRQSAPYVDAPPDSWTTAIPLLVLQGESDNWTPAKPCAAFLRGAQARQAPVTFQIYPGAYHSFDAPDMPIHTVERYRNNDWAPIEGTNEEARADARDRVAHFLAEHLGMP